MPEAPIHLVQPLESDQERSALAGARLARQLTREEAARRSGLSVEQVQWLEDGRTYRFPTTEHALLAAVVYGAALGIDRREAMQLAGLPLPPRPLDRNPFGRLAVAITFAVLAVALAVTLTVPRLGGGGSHAAAPRGGGPLLPPTWKIEVTVLNGSGDINYTRQVASRIGALAYRIERVGKANRFDYPRTIIYYEPGGAAIARRLARQLGVESSPLPGGKKPRRLVVIVGPKRLTN